MTAGRRISEEFLLGISAGLSRSEKKLRQRFYERFPRRNQPQPEIMESQSRPSLIRTGRRMRSKDGEIQRKLSQV